MPGNTVRINDSKNLEWYVGDSNIDKVIKTLNENGIVNNVIDEWITDLVDNVYKFVKRKDYTTENGRIESKHFTFFTYRYKYKIIANVKKDYLGCQVTCRKPRAGEDWVRGNDLFDGPLNKETWNKIIVGIIKHELVPLGDLQL